MERTTNRQTTWHLINIKARSEQNTKHYLDVFRKLIQEDPMVKLPRDKYGSLKSMDFCNFSDKDNEPKWIRPVLLSYTIVDKNMFYNRREKEDVSIDKWDSDIVANKKEAEMFFIPSVHTLAVKCNSKISLSNIVLFLSEALDRIEPETFDVNVVVERDFLDRILNAHAVLRIEANVSFSNHGNTSGFVKAFDDKIRGMRPDKFTITAKGTKVHPLVNEDDGMLPSIISMSERDGSIKATIQSAEGSGYDNVDSKDHPRILVIRENDDDVSVTVYKAVKSIFTDKQIL